jgi:hypothetical protein
MQALCYFCRKWFHVQCLAPATHDQAKDIQTKKWDCQAPLGLIQTAMQTMRRGYPHNLEGNYARVYQAQSILSAHQDGNSARLEAWIEKYGDVTPRTDTIGSDDIYLCPECGYVI